MITKILILAAVLIGIFCIVAAMQRSDFVVTRSTTIATPPSVPFALVNNLHTWQERISPYTKFDPAATYRFAGPAEGVGASLHWEGNGKIGAGTMTIVDSRPGELVRFRIDFEKPFKSTSVGEFTFKPDGANTSVSWSMGGQKVFVTKAMSLVLNMDKMIGADFETGLVNLKNASESQPKA